MKAMISIWMIIVIVKITSAWMKSILILDIILYLLIGMIVMKGILDSDVIVNFYLQVNCLICMEILVYTKLKYIKLPVDPEAFMKNLVEFYFNEKFYEKIESVNLFVQNLPKLNKINEILKLKLYTDKDLLPIKLVLDIYENYYKNDFQNYEVKK